MSSSKRIITIVVDESSGHVDSLKVDELDIPVSDKLHRDPYVLNESFVSEINDLIDYAGSDRAPFIADDEYETLATVISEEPPSMNRADILAWLHKLPTDYIMNRDAGTLHAEFQRSLLWNKGDVDDIGSQLSKQWVGSI